MSARWITADVYDGLATLEDGSVDLIVTSPPFLALRSYLPADHPDKSKEIGSEATPAEFIDTLLNVTAELRRVLAPHGSICVELGDSFAGSGGAGGDYDDDGWRNGQPRFGGSASRGRSSNWSYPDALWLAGVIDTDGSIHVHRNDRGEKSPSFVVWVRITMMDREVCDRAAAITGLGNVKQDKRGAYTWAVSAQQARYVLLNIWPYLLIKQRQAKACIELAGRIEAFGGRGTYAQIPDDELAWREMVKEYVTGLNARGDERGKYVPTWEPPEPHRIRHDVIGGTGWPLSKSKALIPQLYEIALAYGINPLTGQPSPAGQWRIRNVVTWARPNPPVGALGDKWRPATSDLIVACTSSKRYWDDLATRRPFLHPDHNEHNGQRGGPTFGLKGPNLDRGDLGAGNFHSPHSGAPLLDYWEIPPGGYQGAHYAVFPQELVVPCVKAMCPEKVCRVCGEPSRRIVGQTEEYAEFRARKNAGERTPTGHTDNVGNRDQSWDHHDDSGARGDRHLTLGWTDCGHGSTCPTCNGEGTVTWADKYPTCPNCDGGGRLPDHYRPGIVLDPFAGSGTTLAVATGHGHDAIGIDLDPKNVTLARERIGPFFFEEVGVGELQPETSP